MGLRTCVSKTGFKYGIHQPVYNAVNLRRENWKQENYKINNFKNFPAGDVGVQAGEKGWVFEIPNAFPFMGTTFIQRSKADKGMDGREEKNLPSLKLENIDLDALPVSVKIALAQTSDDPDILKRLAESPDKLLREIVSNNPNLYDDLKRETVLIPGAQGASEIIGDHYGNGSTHIFEYLRSNSYLPWGHYAANMAHDAIRYKAGNLTQEDIKGLRHLYYQRIYVQLAQSLGVPLSSYGRRELNSKELEGLRKAVLGRINARSGELEFTASIWGQNFGYDFSPSGHKLHASHQQVHQQYALVPKSIPVFQNGANEKVSGNMPSYVQGDDVARFCEEYRKETGLNFFDTYINTIRSNRRMDGKEQPRDLIVHENKDTILFVPKAQRSPWELQIMTTDHTGNILEADVIARQALDESILIALKLLEKAGASLITVYEISKRFDDPDTDQHLMYCFSPRVPDSPAGWSELQDRWVVKHYPEDFAKKCRTLLPT